ncbi:LytR C-terminal domain-containing protein [Streptomyces sp. NPDC001941]|uniref:LytR C-terminal domain-containing protein n=1 Tax=Streptomyces sp. NPDC001941 TaxID=3154659 RepID=UPI00331D1924
MNDQHNPYDPYYQQPQIIGYDEYGQPVYQQAPQQAQPQQQDYGYDPYGGQQAYDPYGQQDQQPPQQGYGYDPYGQQPVADTGQQQGYQQFTDTGQQPGYPSAAHPGAYQQQPADTGQFGTGQFPQHTPADTGQFETGQFDTGQFDTGQWGTAPQYSEPHPGHAAPPQEEPRRRPAPSAVADPEAAVPGPRRPEADGEPDCHTEQFAFIEEPDEDSEDVIDWLKFTESRSERREEAKRRGRNRVVALVVVAALLVVGGVGYLWYADKLPFLSGSDGSGATTATGPQKRDTIVVHLHDTKKGGTSTALLVNNATTKQGTTVLLPNALVVADDEGNGTTLGKSVDGDGSAGTRDSVGDLLGTKIAGTWRLDTPFLDNLVELVGGIEVSTDAQVPGAKKGDEPLVEKGEDQTLNGRAAVAYATWRAPGEAEAKQLMRFGQVMYGVLRKLSSDPASATVTVESLPQVFDPSLPAKDLAASLAKLAEHAKGGDYKTALLPVRSDGTLTDASAQSVVKDVLGGAVKSPDTDGTVRVGVKNATGNAGATESARITLVNGGFTFVDGGKQGAEAKTAVLYAQEAQKSSAQEVAKTLGLQDSAVRKGAGAGNTQVTVVLGKDYKVK